MPNDSNSIILMEMNHHVLSNLSQISLPWDEARGFCCQCLQALLDLQQRLHGSRV